MPLSFRNATINYSVVRERLQRLVTNRKLCDCAFAMASLADIHGQFTDAPCMHSRLILETTTATARYLTGYYVCEECGQHFDRPPIKQDPPIEQDSPPTPAT